MPEGRNPSGGEEVPVVPPPRHVSKVAPDYFTITLPYADSFRDGGAHTTPLNYVYRLNSIWDPNKTQTGHRPMGRDAWAGVYDYYRVLRTDVKITWQNFQDDPFNGETTVVGFELTDDATSAVTTSVNAFMEGKHNAALILPGLSTAPFNYQVQQYSYTPETWTYHVQEKGMEERWTPIGADPSNVHDLVLRAYRHNSGHTTANRKLTFTIQLLYTVQFREAKHTIIGTEVPQA